MNIIDDERKIRSITTNGDGYYCASDTVDIVAYEENGEMAKIVWFKIVINSKITKRINGKYVITIEYK